MGRPRVYPLRQDKRVNVKLRTEEEENLYHDLKAESVNHRTTLHDVIIPALRWALAGLRKKPLSRK